MFEKESSVRRSHRKQNERKVEDIETAWLSGPTSAKSTELHFYWASRQTVVRKGPFVGGRREYVLPLYEWWSKQA